MSAPAGVVARGKYLAEAADCAACHTAPGGAPYAGGLAMPSGFGTIFATNITPDPDDGIGRWSAEDFWRALHDGIRRDGQQLYPAMPYTSYRGMTRADADAIYAYVMQLLPMKVANRRTELNFPFNIRLGMLGWNALFLHDSLPAVSAGNSPAWQRGRYLVNVLGHCGECHTPRGIAGEMELSRALTGFALSRVAAPDITPAGLASRGWTAAGLRAYLGRGLARQGSAFGDMHPVIMLSTRNLTAEDLDAVAIYLLGDNPPPPASLSATDATESAVASGAGRTSYVALCAGCHTAVWASFQRPFKHRLPEGAMSCVDCHNPHGSFLPNSIQTIPADQNWSEVRKNLPGKAAPRVPTVFVSTEPAELILLDGPPRYAAVPTTSPVAVRESPPMAWATPKSVSFAGGAASGGSSGIRMLEGLTSRWMIPSPWA